MLSLEQMTGDEEVKQAKVKAHADLMLHFNEQVADRYILIAQEMMREGDVVADSLVISLFLLKSMLGVFCEANFENEHAIPVELRNVGYYSEQVLGQLAHMYIEEKKKEAVENNEGV